VDARAPSSPGYCGSVAAWETAHHRLCEYLFAYHLVEKIRSQRKENGSSAPRLEIAAACSANSVAEPMEKAGERHQEFRDHRKTWIFRVLAHFRSGVAVIEMDCPVVILSVLGIVPVGTYRRREHADRSYGTSSHLLMGNHRADETKLEVDSILVVVRLDHRTEGVDPRVLLHCDTLR
jgi:hypothetical protein